MRPDEWTGARGRYDVADGDLYFDDGDDLEEWADELYIGASDALVNVLTELADPPEAITESAMKGTTDGEYSVEQAVDDIRNRRMSSLTSWPPGGHVLGTAPEAVNYVGGSSAGTRPA